MFVGGNYGVVGLTRLLNEEMTGVSFGTQKIGRSNRVVVLAGWLYWGGHCK